MSTIESEPMTAPTTPGPGIYDGVSFDTYCKWDAVNFSRLKLMSISPAHYRYGYKGSTKALQFGRLAHSGVLESASVPLLYAVMPAYELDADNQDAKGKSSTSKATTYYKERKAEFEHANLGREIVAASTYQDMVDLLKAIEANPRAVEYLNSPGRVEVSMLWTDPDTGLLCKARADKVAAGGMTDLKTTQDASNFTKAIMDYSYHRQAAHYTDGWRILSGEDIPFRIVAVSKTNPIAVRSAPIHEDAIRTGQSQNRIDLDRVAECKASGDWPNLSDPDAWTLPDWYVNKIIDSQVSYEGIEDA